MQKTVEAPQLPSRIGSCSSWTRSLTCPLCPTTGAWGLTEQKTVEVPQLQLVDLFEPGRRHLCRGAEADSHGPVQETIEIFQLLYIDKVVDVLVVPVQLPSAGVEKTAELPQLQLSSSGQGR